MKVTGYHVRALYISGVVLFSLVVVVAGALTASTVIDEPDNPLGAFANFGALLLVLPNTYVAQHTLSRTRRANPDRANADRRVVRVVGIMAGIGALVLIVRTAMLAGNMLFAAVTIVLAAATLAFSWFVGNRVGAQGGGSTPATASRTNTGRTDDIVTPAPTARLVLGAIAVGVFVLSVGIALIAGSEPRIALAIAFALSGFATAVAGIVVLRAPNRALRQISAESPIGGGPISRVVLSRKDEKLSRDQRLKAVAYARTYLAVLPYTAATLGWFFLGLVIAIALTIGDPGSLDGSTITSLVVVPIALVVGVVVLARQYQSARMFLGKYSR